MHFRVTGLIKVLGARTQSSTQTGCAGCACYLATLGMTTPLSLLSCNGGEIFSEGFTVPRSSMIYFLSLADSPRHLTEEEYMKMGKHKWVSSPLSSISRFWIWYLPGLQVLQVFLMPRYFLMLVPI